MKKSVWQERLDELQDDGDDLSEVDQQEKKKKKKKHKKQLGEVVQDKNMLQRFNETQAKGNLANSLLKTAADIAGVGVGTVLSTATGKVAPLVGIVLLGAGHYIGDDSGLMRVAGASTLAHSIAKAREYRQEGQTIGVRFKGLKDDWLMAALLKHSEEVEPAAIVDTKMAEAEPDPQPVQTVGSVPQHEPEFQLDEEDRQYREAFEQEQAVREFDMSGLDRFEQFNEQQAEEYENEQEEHREQPKPYAGILDFLNRKFSPIDKSKEEDGEPLSEFDLEDPDDVDFTNF